MSQDEPRFGCPKCTSAQNVYVHTVRIHVQARAVKDWSEDGMPRQSHVVDEGRGKAPEEYDLDLGLKEVDDNMKYFHCSSCGIRFDEPARINDTEGQDW